jgi:membrane associated rhomboid family serine protease
MTPAVKWIIWANIGAFVATVLSHDLIYVLGLSPANVIGRLWLWQPVTYMFLHAGPAHILFNMLGVWMFGVELERMWGTRFFVR